MLNFISFGSGSSGNCYYLYTATDGLLIDTGIGIRALKRYFKAYGMQISDVHHVLITHDHADHIKSVGSLSHDYQLPIYTTRAVHQGISKSYCVQRKISSELARVIEKGVSFDVGEFHVTAFGVPHDSNDNVGYFIEVEGTCFCLITDAGSMTDEMKSYISKSNYLVLEANHDEEMLKQGPYPEYLQERILSDIGHMSNKNCAKYLVENMTEKLKKVWLCHLSEENNHPELARKTVESTLRQHGILPGVDIQLEVLKRKIPSDIEHLVP